MLDPGTAKEHRAGIGTKLECVSHFVRQKAQDPNEARESGVLQTLRPNSEPEPSRMKSTTLSPNFKPITPKPIA